MYNLKKMQANTLYSLNLFLKKRKYNLNHAVVIVFNCICVYARDSTIVLIKLMSESIP